MPKIFSPAFYQETEQLLSLYPRKVNALLPILHLVQKERGFIDKQAMEEVASLVEVPLTHVEGVVTFYTMFATQKRGKNYIGVCTNVACWLKGGAEILEHIEKTVGIHSGETSPDDKFFLEEVECLGACGYAPVVLGNEEYLLEMDQKKLDSWLEKQKL